ncbi:hypothetical protein [Methylobacterium marchantiae]|uniref:Uncharacterized protein n=1 Tax=Methylobacterium marchantiae TaxID=600331 RepID=A0ABW3X2N3_9HYPH|nr:hypothetical protein AIGOOFII_3508 [Methylobacterium marchantiae]
MSSTRSRLKVGQGYFGPLPDDIWALLNLVQDYPLAVSSNLAREAAGTVALAASMGWISCVDPDGKGFSRRWRITPEGAFASRNREHGT